MQRHRPDRTRCRPPRRDRTCGACKGELANGTTLVPLCGLWYHSRCFTCSDCKVSLKGKKFESHAGVLYCSTHLPQRGPKNINMNPPLEASLAQREETKAPSTSPEAGPFLLIEDEGKELPLEDLTQLFRYREQPADDLDCPVCFQTIIEPLTHEDSSSGGGCDNSLCGGCWRKVVASSSSSPRCPVCRLEDPLMKPCTARIVLRQLDGLPVLCNLCGKQMARGDLEQHLRRSCPSVSVCCSARDLGCDFVATRDPMAGHQAECLFSRLRHAFLMQQKRYERQIEALNARIASLEAKENVGSSSSPKLAPSAHQIYCYDVIAKAERGDDGRVVARLSSKSGSPLVEGQFIPLPRGTYRFELVPVSPQYDREVHTSIETMEGKTLHQEPRLDLGRHRRSQCVKLDEAIIIPEEMTMVRVVMQKMPHPSWGEREAKAKLFISACACSAVKKAE